MTYDYHAVLTVFSIAFGVLGYAIYIWSIFRATRPHIFTWLIFAAINVIVFAAQVSKGGGVGSIVVLFGTIGNLAVVALALRRGERNITVSDWICFAAAILSVGLWMLTDDALSAVLVLTAANGLALSPTFRKAFNKPDQESISVWLCDIFRFGISIPALAALNLTTILFPAGIVAMNATLIFFILIRRMKLGRL